MGTDAPNTITSPCPFTRPLSGTVDWLQVELRDPVDVEANKDAWCNEISEMVRQAHSEQSGLPVDRFHIPVRIESGSIWIEVLHEPDVVLKLLAAYATIRPVVPLLRRDLKRLTETAAFRTIGQYARFILVKHTQAVGILDSLAEQHAAGNTSLGAVISETLKNHEALTSQGDLAADLRTLDRYYELLATGTDQREVKNVTESVPGTRAEPEIVDLKSKRKVKWDLE